MNKDNGRGKGSSGFTLYEVMISVFIFTIGILAIMGTVPWLIKGARQAEMYTNASMLSQSYMEDILADPDFNGLTTNYNDSSSTRRDITGHVAFKANLKVVDRNGTGGLVKEVTVTIFWYSEGKESSFTIVNLRKRT
ncbi:MAG: prepilin-type N-terminal cleavage/methylation domain-containing protein [Chloroflexi bacterium]|nr:prepilin-type N-terminal cleavage/methylation domain-containing protein [Chloroflexota bacterium]